jgi:hypothetical protein
LLAVVLAGGALNAQDASMRRDAAAMEKKMAAITQRANVAAVGRGRSALRTVLTDREVNAYFKVNGKTFLPAGVVDPELQIGQSGRVQAKAVLDLDAALKPQNRSFFDPLAWLGGKAPVTASGTVRAANGHGVLQLESATISGVSIPKSVLQQLISYYTRTPDAPEGFDIDKPFELPANIQAVETAPGQAIVLQP